MPPMLRCIVAQPHARKPDVTCRVAIAAILLVLMTPLRAQPAWRVSEVAPGVFIHHGHIALMSSDNDGDFPILVFVMGPAAVGVIDPGGGGREARNWGPAIRARTKKPI